MKITNTSGMFKMKNCNVFVKKELDVDSISLYFEDA
jgi:hypothetical protein